MPAAYRASRAAVIACAARAEITPSTARIAACTGIPRRTVTRIMSGEAVSRRTAEWLAAELGTTVDGLFDPAAQLRPGRPATPAAAGPPGPGPGH